MKKWISLFLAVTMLLSSFGFAVTVQAVSKPKKVTITSAVLTADRFNKKCTYKVTWKALKGVAGYQIKLAVESGDDSGSYYVKTKTIKGAKKTNYKPSIGYYDPDNYYNAVKIRAYKNKNGKKVYGSWSKVKKTKFKTVNQVTGFKGKILDNDYSPNLELKLTWNKMTGMSGYQIIAHSCYDYNDVTRINVKNKTSYTGWIMCAGIIEIRPYKIVNGKKKYGDTSMHYLDYSSY